MSRKLPIGVLCLMVALTVGCDEDKRAVEIARESANRQAEQNAHMARQSQQVADATKALVDAQKKLQQDVQVERQSLDRQHEHLDTERRTLAAARHREPIIAGALVWSATLLACLAPLGLAGWLIHKLSATENDEGLSELLVHELTTSQPVLFHEPILTIDSRPAPALPSAVIES